MSKDQIKISFVNGGVWVSDTDHQHHVLESGNIVIKRADEIKIGDDVYTGSKSRDNKHILTKVKDVVLLGDLINELALEVEEAKRMEVIVLGRHIGNASGWDELENCVIVFYDFKAFSLDTNIPSNVDLTVDYVNGCFRADTDMSPDFKIDILEALRSVPRTAE